MAIYNSHNGKKLTSKIIFW